MCDVGASSSEFLRVFEIVHAHGAAATTVLVCHGQARRPLIVELSARIFDGLTCVTTRGGRTHDLLDANLRSPEVVRRHTATDVAFGDGSWALSRECADVPGVVDLLEVAGMSISVGSVRVHGDAARRCA